MNLPSISRESRLIAIGDIHGRTAWKKIRPEAYDRIIFIGDYCDGKDLPAAEVVENLREIIAFKKEYPEKIILLLGNHDIQYSEYPRYQFSALNSIELPNYTRLFAENRHLFQVAFQTGNRLFTHAGVSNAYAQHELAPYYEAIVDHSIDLGSLLNEIQNGNDQSILHTIGPIRGGNDPFGGITWADFSETSNSLLPGYHQIVGHTRVREITTRGDSVSSITYIDVLGTREEFYELKNEFAK
jgi:predicted MPP superfamily phosphohydrolase